MVLPELKATKLPEADSFTQRSIGAEQLNTDVDCGAVLKSRTYFVSIIEIFCSPVLIPLFTALIVGNPTTESL